MGMDSDSIGGGWGYEGRRRRPRIWRGARLEARAGLSVEEPIFAAAVEARLCDESVSGWSIEIWAESSVLEEVVGSCGVAGSSEVSTGWEVMLEEGSRSISPRLRTAVGSNSYWGELSGV